MTAFVLDNSVCMRWCFKNTAAPYADHILSQLVAGDEAYVPVLWLYEVASVLAKGQRDKLITASDAANFVTDLQALRITVDLDSAEHVLTGVHQLAVTHGLTGYDAAYLELAIRRNLALATLDDKLIRVCKTLGHPLITAT